MSPVKANPSGKGLEAGRAQHSSHHTPESLKVNTNTPFKDPISKTTHLTLNADNETGTVTRAGCNDLSTVHAWN